MTNANSIASTPSDWFARRWMRWLLVGSVTVNLLIGGLVIGRIIGHPDGERPGMVRDLGFGVYNDALSKDDKQALRRAFLAKAPQFREARKQMRADMAGLLASLRATPFDPADLKAKLDKQNARTAAQLALGQDLIRELLLDMAPEARLAFADRLEERLRHGPGDRGADHGPDHDPDPKAAPPAPKPAPAP